MNTTQLPSLSEDKTSTFYSPLAGKNYILVRTGVKSSPESLIHASLYATSDKYYYASPKQREKMVQKICKKLQEKFIVSDYIDTCGFEEFKNMFFSNIKTAYTTVNKGGAEKGKDFFTKTITKKFFSTDEKKSIFLLGFDIVKENVITDVDSSVDSIEKLKNKFIEIVISEFSKLKVGKGDIEKRKKFCQDELISLFTFILNLTKNDFDRKFCLDKYWTNIFSDYIKKNIYFLNSSTRMPIYFLDKSSYKKRDSIILMINSVRSANPNFDAVGNLLENNKIERVFNISESLTKKIHMCLFNTPLLEENYPELSYIMEVFKPSIDLKTLESPKSPKSPKSSRKSCDDDEKNNSEDDEEVDESHSIASHEVSDEDENSEDSNSDDEITPSPKHRQSHRRARKSH